MARVTPAEATEASNALYARRADLRHGVKNCGVSLAGLILAHEPAIDTVVLFRLVRWMPYVGRLKAQRILRGLPECLRVEELEPSQRAFLARAVSDHENRNRRRHAEQVHDLRR